MQPINDRVCVWLWRKLIKAKGPAPAKTNDDKQKGATLFGTKPPTPKLLKAFGNFRKGALMDKLKVKSLRWCTAHCW